MYAAAYYASLGALSVCSSLPPQQQQPQQQPPLLVFLPAHAHLAPGAGGARVVAIARGGLNRPADGEPGAGGVAAGAAALREAARRAGVRVEFAHVWLLVKLLLASLVLNPEGSRLRGGLLTAAFTAVFLAQIGVLAPLLRRLQDEAAAAAAAVDAAAVANANRGGAAPGAAAPHGGGGGGVVPDAQQQQQPQQHVGGAPARRTLRQEIALLAYGFAASLFPGWAPPGVAL